MATIFRGKRRGELEAYSIEIGANKVCYPRCSGWELNNSDHLLREALKSKFPEAVIVNGSPEYPGEVHLN